MSRADLTKIAELVEAEFMHRWGANAPESVLEAFGVTTGRIGGGVMLSLRNDPMGGFFNKALGFGITEPVTEKLITEIVDFYREHGSPLVHIQIAPEFLPGDWAEIAAAHGLTPGATLVQCAGAVGDVKPASTGLRVGPVGDQEIDEWAALTWELFGAPNEHLAASMSAAARSGMCHAFAAWDGDQMVGVANLFLDGESAHLNCAATRESHRRRGVQSALIAARAEAAAAAGCRWLVVEVDKPEVEGANPSLNKVARLGLTPLYDRTEWTWRPETAKA
ncbi:acetyltransferase (GNAT) family protein [Micromonospora pisi]|uniref:Acetyltransferase (GNAT) family protein n=1 Tax=Micromonospora pisi TaxID=589240 RepID=A0A495JB23_9ACTN|nr:GNAT family N-acetyltransferase [Micromonospora pisi]RKR86127.1 acetyltransferase (GNAT) family protein [Micromonospora pisi]